MLNPPGSPAAIPASGGLRPATLRPTLSDGLPFSDDYSLCSFLWPYAYSNSRAILTFSEGNPLAERPPAKLELLEESLRWTFNYEHVIRVSKQSYRPVLRPKEGQIEKRAKAGGQRGTYIVGMGGLVPHRQVE